jgi:hypothetical protein
MNSLEKRIMARVPEQLKLKHQKVVQTPFGKMENHSYVKPTELTDEEKREKREKEWSKEMFLQGMFLGFLLGAIYIAVFSTILERFF